MTNSTENPSAQPPNTTNSAAQSAAEVPPAGAPAEPKAPHVDDLIAQMRLEISDLKDKFLRGQAEVENMRKRTEREKDETAKYAITKFARDIVGAADNFQRAIAAVPAGAADQDPALKTLVEGVTMSEREFLNVMERHGIKRLEPKGETFNPHQHQAMMEMEEPAVPAGTVLQVFQAGYMIEDRVLRPALVVVAKGGAKAPKPGDGASTTTAEAGAAAPEASASPPNPNGQPS